MQQHPFPRPWLNLLIRVCRVDKQNKEHKKSITLPGLEIQTKSFQGKQD